MTSGHDAQRWARERGARTLPVKIRADRGLAAEDVERLLTVAAEVEADGRG